MTDIFESRADAVSAPASRAIAVTPDDSAALGRLPKALYIGEGGTLTLRAAADATDSVWRNVPSGTVLPIRASHVRATGTTASGILALS